MEGFERNNMEWLIILLKRTRIIIIWLPRLVKELDGAETCREEVKKWIMYSINYLLETSTDENLNHKMPRSPP